jgi:hypothetical protein
MYSIPKIKKYGWPGNSPRSFRLQSRILCILLLFLTGISFAATPGTGSDSTKQKYGINDPHNPDCPCHKYQQQAEDEYQALLLKKHTYSAKSKRRVWFHMFHFRNLNRSQRHGQVKKGKCNHSACSRWN